MAKESGLPHRPETILCTWTSICHSLTGPWTSFDFSVLPLVSYQFPEKIQVPRRGKCRIGDNELEDLLRP